MDHSMWVGLLTAFRGMHLSRCNVVCKASGKTRQGHYATTALFDSHGVG